MAYDYDRRTKLAVNLEHALDWWVNALNEMGHDDDPEEDLAAVLHDKAVAHRMWHGYMTMNPADQRKFDHDLMEDEDAVMDQLEAWAHH